MRFGYSFPDRILPTVRFGSLLLPLRLASAALTPFFALRLSVPQASSTFTGLFDKDGKKHGVSARPQRNPRQY